MADVPLQRDESFLAGRLVAMPSTNAIKAFSAAQDDGFRKAVSIEFPAMPDTLELARATDYSVDSNIIMPDGMHQYRSTKPMEIPFSFKLHFMDKAYCKNGALTLIQVAARLHSFILPVSTFRRGQTLVAPQYGPVSGNDLDSPNSGKGQPKEAQLLTTADKQTVYSVQRINGDAGQIYSPVTCWLSLMSAGADQPGISCIGYVKDVRVVFAGPWRRGPNQSFNLPTSAEYSFTFMHRPGHGNSVPFTNNLSFPASVADMPHAYANDVKDDLYNTRSLVTVPDYQGFRN